MLTIHCKNNEYDQLFGLEHIFGGLKDALGMKGHQDKGGAAQKKA